MRVVARGFHVLAREARARYRVQRRHEGLAAEDGPKANRTVVDEERGILAERGELICKAEKDYGWDWVGQVAGVGPPDYPPGT